MNRRRSFQLLGLSLAAFALAGGLAYVGVWSMLRVPTLIAGEYPMDDYKGTVTAPEFPGGMQWLNTDRPLELANLRGKVVLLDFWTYCCINCMHVLPDLKKLEEKYPNELVVIGVHSAKFTGEKDTDNIRQAILRYNISHPVVNDKDMRIWRAYGVRAWPTLVLIDPAGKIVGQLSGEGVYDTLDTAIGRVIKNFGDKVDRTPLNLTLERAKAKQSLLAFPGKVLADEKSGRLFIADSNHNRLVVVSLKDGTVQDVIGSGRAELKDGDFTTAAFKNPQGMALDGGMLYVADTDNHAIRRVDLKKKTVATLAGTGTQARRFNTGGPGLKTPLNSPWDVVLNDHMLYIAMAGPHQLWRLDLSNGRATPYAGSGREARIDGTLTEAALAQPSGITTDGRRLYFADSEVSSIRSADLKPLARVDTLVGGDLFDFGDIDGPGRKARLQHPLGVAYADGVVYVADTYNNKIKRLDLSKNTITTFLGTGAEGLNDGPADKATFNEPGGLSAAGGKLYIADTNNNVIRVADLKTGRVETLMIREMQMLRPPTPAGMSAVKLPAQTVAPGDATVTIALALPKGMKLNPAAPSAVTVTSSDKNVARFGKAAETTLKPKVFPVEVPVTLAEGAATLTIDVAAYYCSDNEALCYFKEARLAVPITVSKDAEIHAIRVEHPLK